MPKKKTKQPHSQRKHAKISPSGLKSFKICPGFVREDDPNQPVHPVTLEGTEMHEAIENDAVSKLDPHMQELCEICTNYASMLPSSLGEVVDEPKLVATAGVFGFADRVQKLGQSVDVLDWKFGWNQVDDADVNCQGKSYVLGAFNKFPDARDVTVHFIQPRIGFTTCHTFTREQVPELDFEIRQIIASTKNAKPENFNPVPSNCQYCSRYDCPALGELAYKAARGYLKGQDERKQVEASLRGEPLPDPQFDSLPTEFYPRKLEDPAEVAKALDLAPVLQNWATSVRRRASQMRIQEGIEIPGWELKHRKETKRITNGYAAYQVVKDRVSVEDFVSICKPQLTALRDFYADGSPGGTKAAASRELENRLHDLDAISGGKEEVGYLSRTK